MENVMKFDSNKFLGDHTIFYREIKEEFDFESLKETISEISPRSLEQMRSKNMGEIIINEHATFWTESNGILFCKITNFNSYKQLDYKKAKIYIEAIVKLTKGVPMPFLIDLRDVKGSFSIAAAQFISKSLKSLPLITAEAYVLNSLAINLLILSYKRIYDTKIPHEVFNDISKAKKYCLENKFENTTDNFDKILENN